MAQGDSLPRNQALNVNWPTIVRSVENALSLAISRSITRHIAIVELPHRLDLNWYLKVVEIWLSHDLILLPRLDRLHLDGLLHLLALLVEPAALGQMLVFRLLRVCVSELLCVRLLVLQRRLLKIGSRS